MNIVPRPAPSPKGRAETKGTRAADVLLNNRLAAGFEKRSLCGSAGDNGLAFPSTNSPNTEPVRDTDLTNLFKILSSDYSLLSSKSKFAIKCRSRKLSQRAILVCHRNCDFGVLHVCSADLYLHCTKCITNRTLQAYVPR
jgi:hypothetical protein